MCCRPEAELELEMQRRYRAWLVVEVTGVIPVITT